ncbi:hypothetical protein F442_21457 [Phytophthora nicotianae P10297]|uniref:DUF6570 domain-containing protein n=1 Tax=Phytophthora nicotianae P10297 TaxID=1317064 RepID=W2Y415_PHYNI|nr:hypothetical protein F442_21457 [Phytophthora nicotianae P10297]
MVVDACRVAQSQQLPSPSQTTGISACKHTDSESPTTTGIVPQQLPRLVFRRQGSRWQAVHEGTDALQVSITTALSSTNHKADGGSRQYRSSQENLTGHLQQQRSSAGTTIGCVRERTPDSDLTTSEMRPRKLPCLVLRRRDTQWTVEAVNELPETSKVTDQTTSPWINLEADRFRAYRAQVHQQKEEQSVYSYDELAAIDTDYQFAIPSDERLADIQDTTMKKMTEYQVEDAVCGVCEMLHAPDRVNIRPLGAELLKELRANTGNSPPAMAIANGNYIGWLPPHLSTLSRTDEQCIALVSPCVALSTLTGGHCKGVESHHYIVKNTEGPVLGMLPRDLTNKVRVTMVGVMISDQQAACRKSYELNFGLYLATLAEVAKTSVVIDRTSGSESPLQGDALEQALRDDSTYSTFGSTIGEGDSVALEQTAVSSSKILLQQKDASTDVLVRKSNAYVQSRN